MGDDATSPQILVVRRLFRAPPEQVFELWTNPELMARWMSPYRGQVVTNATADVRVGGTYRLEMGSPDSRCEIEGTYLEVQAPRRLVFTWAGPPTLGVRTLVTLELRAGPGGGTELVLTQERLPGEVSPGHLTGWSNLLDHLEDEHGARLR